MIDLSVVKEAAKIIQKAGQMDLYQKLIDFQQISVKLSSNNQSLRERVNSLEEVIKVKEKIAFRDNACWVLNKDGIEKGPYCSACWDVGKGLVNLHIRKSDSFCVCPCCKNVPDDVFTKKEEIPAYPVMRQKGKAITAGIKDKQF